MCGSRPCTLNCQVTCRSSTQSATDHSRSSGSSPPLYSNYSCQLHGRSTMFSTHRSSPPITKHWHTASTSPDPHQILWMGKGNKRSNTFSGIGNMGEDNSYNTWSNGRDFQIVTTNG